MIIFTPPINTVLSSYLPLTTNSSTVTFYPNPSCCPSFSPYVLTSCEGFVLRRAGHVEISLKVKFWLADWQAALWMSPKCWRQIRQAGTHTPLCRPLPIFHSLFLYMPLPRFFQCPSFLYLCLQSHFVVLLVAGFVDGADAGADIPWSCSELR